MSYIAINQVGETKTACGHKHRTHAAAMDCANEIWGQHAKGTITIIERAPRPKQLSRAARLGEALSHIGTLNDEIDTVKEYIEDLQNAADDPDYDATNMPDMTRVATILDEARSAQDEVQALLEEMESWRDNLDSANMSHLPKYDEVSDCVDALQDLVDRFDSELTEFNTPTTPDLAAWEEYLTDLEASNDTLEELQNADGDVMFPGMF